MWLQKHSSSEKGTVGIHTLSFKQGQEAHFTIMIKHLSLIFLASLTLGHVIFPRDPIPQDQELSASDSATPPQPTDAKAIVPTESGQIGINPVTVPNIPLSEM